MALNTISLKDSMLTAAQNATTGIWVNIQNYAIPELEKIATQIVAIEINKSAYTEAGAKALLDMQIKASIGVIVAMTTLTLLTIQTLINEILGAIKTTVNIALGFPLIA